MLETACLLMFSFNISASDNRGINNIANVSHSPWDKEQSELIEQVDFPIVYKSHNTSNTEESGHFKYERKKLGYNPRFVPMMLGFTNDDTPVTRVTVPNDDEVGSHALSVPDRFFSRNSYIQFLSDDGKWLVTQSHITSIREHFDIEPTASVEILGGNRVPDQIVFDTDDNAYTIVTARIAFQNKVLQKEVLLFSTDFMNSWSVYELTHGSDMKLEYINSHNLKGNIAPAIVSSREITIGTIPKWDNNKNVWVEGETKPLVTSDIYLTIPKVTVDGLEFSSPIKIASGIRFKVHNVMAGASNNAVSLGENTYVIYSNIQSDEKGSTLAMSRQGVPQYIVSYNRRTNILSEPVFLGYSGDNLDGHNTAVVGIDSQGYLHAVLGAHWHSMKYMKSKKPHDISQWNEPEFIAGNGDNSWSRDGLTYAGLLIDNNDAINLIVRARNKTLSENDPTLPSDPNYREYGDNLDYALVYFRKEPHQRWSDIQRVDLVVPKHKGYSNWYHKVAINNRGNIFVTYMYYAHRLKGEALNDYINNWGETDGKGGNVLAHDPVLIMSDNNGVSWKIAESSDF